MWSSRQALGLARKGKATFVFPRSTVARTPRTWRVACECCIDVACCSVRCLSAASDIRRRQRESTATRSFGERTGYKSLSMLQRHVECAELFWDITRARSKTKSAATLSLLFLDAR